MVVECSHCGAPLEVKPGARLVVCSYCSSTNRLEQAKVVVQVTPANWRPPPQWTPPSRFAAKSAPMPFLGHTALQSPKKMVRNQLIVVLFIVAVTTALPIAGVFGPRIQAALFPWKGNDTFVCSGNDELTISGVKVNAKTSPAIVVEVNCKLHIKDSKITAKDLLEVRGNGKVLVENSTLTVTGARGIRVSSNGNFKAKKTRIRIVPTGTAAKVTGIRGSGNFTITLLDSSLELTPSRPGGAVLAIAVGGNKKIELRDTRVIFASSPKPGALTLFKLDGNGSASVEGGAIKAGGRPVAITSSRQRVTISGTTIEAQLTGKFKTE